jgi:fluoroquinolone transport system permease protein
MMRRFKSSFIADMKIISHDALLLVTGLIPLLLILLLKFVFPLISHLVFLKSGFILDKYYSLAALTIVSLIPVFLGMLYAFILLDENDLKIIEESDMKPFSRGNSLYMRILVTASLSLILIYISIFLINPVPGEGWLRTLFVVILLSLQSPFVFLFIVSLAENKIEGFALSKIYGFFLITVPLGLVLHHPWNYLAFFSPLYWISWAWIVQSPVESMIYGTIAVILTSGAIIFFFRRFFMKHTI